jgi:two-component sensor histidine kinase
VAECIEAFRSRLRALSAAHNALIAENWHWASLAWLVQTALEPPERQSLLLVLADAEDSNSRYLIGFKSTGMKSLSAVST